MNILTYRETQRSVDLSYECTNLRKSRTMLCECANVQRNVEKARLINRRTYSCTEKSCEDVTQREMLGTRETIIVWT